MNEIIITAIKNAIRDNNAIILDTNVYLNIYDVSPELAKFELSVLDKITDQIIVPSTVKREFDRNHEECHGRQKKKIGQLGRRIEQNIESTRSKIMNQCNIIKSLEFPGVDDLSEALETKLDEMANIVSGYSDEHNMLEFLNECIISEDQLAGLISNLKANGHILNELTIDDIYALSEKADQRYENNTPPGYRDEKTKRGKTGIQLYGDYLIWEETLRYSKQKGTSIIFVTDDAKSDWWETDEDGNKYFHPLLVREFYERTGVEILGITSSSFFSAVADLYEVKKSPAIVYALEYSADNYVDNIVDNDVFSEIIIELVSDAEMYFDDEYFDYIEFSEDIDSEFLAYEYGGCDNDVAEYYLTYKVKMEATSKEYWCKDYDTKEVLYSNPTLHEIVGQITLKVTRKIDGYMDIEDDNAYDVVHIESGELDIIKSGGVCVQCGIRIGEYLNEDNEPICDTCMRVDEHGDICTFCGRKVGLFSLNADLMCSDCARKEERNFFNEF